MNFLQIHSNFDSHDSLVYVIGFGAVLLWLAMSVCWVLIGLRAMKAHERLPELLAAALEKK